MNIRQLFPKLRYGSTVRVPLRYGDLMAFKEIQIASKRYVVDLVRYFLYKELLKETPETLVNSEYLVRSWSSYPCIQVELPRRTVLELRDIGWQYKTNEHLNGNRVGYIIANSVRNQLQEHSQEYWASFFTTGEDLIEQVVKEIELYERRCRTRSEFNGITRRHYSCRQHR